jgi:hypothetical protein
MKLYKAIHHATQQVIRDGKFVSERDDRDVDVLSVYGMWAMVRRPHCLPYVAPLKEIEVPADAGRKSLLTHS